MESMSYRENPKPPTSYKVGGVGQLFVGVGFADGWWGGWVISSFYRVVRLSQVLDISIIFNTQYYYKHIFIDKAPVVLGNS